MNTKSKKSATLLWLVESALMLAVATVLSEYLTVKMPFGGSITIFGQVPILLIAYRHGFGRGLLTSLAFGGIEMIYGRANFSYVKTFLAVFVVAVLDYLIAFGALSLGGIFRGKFNKVQKIHFIQSFELCLGAIVACSVRYICHTLSGIFVWGEWADAAFFKWIPFLYNYGSGLSGLPLIVFYSIGYNAAYMLPETILSVIALFALGRLIDFRTTTPRLGVANSTAA